jgi:S-DNA-T family DNA segregation ATPase FtsK/SpoIIIE
MARSKSASKNKSSGSSRVSYQRKQEIFGLILMVLALLLTIALVTYSPADRTIVSSFTWERALDPNHTQTQNALGLIGASLAYILIPNFLGYPVLILCGLLGVWGYHIFRRRPFTHLPWISGLIVASVVIVACMVSWFSIVLETDLQLFSGIWGIGIASWFYNIFGGIGSILIFSLLGVINLLLLFDHDVQRSMDRVEQALLRIGTGVREWWTNWQEERRQRNQARATERKHAEQEQKKTSPEAQTDEDRPNGSQPAVEPASGGGDGHPGPSGATSDEAERLTLNDLYARQQQQRPPAEPSPTNTSETTTAEEEPSAAAAEQNSPQPADDTDGPELHVRQQVQEEKANLDERQDQPTDEDIDFTFPSVDLLVQASEEEQDIDLDELEQNKRILLEKLKTYDVDITDIGAVIGPTVTLYELTPASGVRVSRVTRLEDDLAMALAADGIRMIAPIPGKSAIGVEIPNRDRELVRVHGVLNTSRFTDADMELPIAMGKTVEGEVFVQDLARMPHLLIAGATGSGKSVGINALITGLLYACHPRDLKFVLIDPKKIELQQYENLYKHYIATPEDAENPIITDFDQAIGTLNACVKEMENRYDLLSEAGVRGIVAYNEKFDRGALNPEQGHHHMPYIVVIIDELADLMMTSGKDVEGSIARLAQMARAVGIHLVLATQRPSVDVITGLIKANFPARIAYQVASNVDSRTILDQKGAEQLVGNGDMLFMNGSRMIRLQGPFISVEEVEKVTTFIGKQEGYGVYQLPPIDENAGGLGDTLLPDSDTDELFEKAARVIVRHQQGSVSLLQRKLAVGYTRAARIVDQLEEANVVGPFQGSKARDVYVESEEKLDELLGEGDQQDEDQS